MVGGAGRDGRQSHPRHACFRNRLAGGGTGSSSSGALCSRRTNARTCHHRRDRSRIPLALSVFALGPPRHLAPGVASNTIHAHGELVRLLVATFRRRLWPLEPWRPACTRPLCVTAGVAAALRWRFKEADGSFSAARSSRACCCFRSRVHWVPAPSQIGGLRETPYAIGRSGFDHTAPGQGALQQVGAPYFSSFFASLRGLGIGR